jgi:hypothetical protein
MTTGWVRRQRLSRANPLARRVAILDDVLRVLGDALRQARLLYVPSRLDDRRGPLGDSLMAGVWSVVLGKCGSRLRPSARPRPLTSVGTWLTIRPRRLPLCTKDFAGNADELATPRITYATRPNERAT